MRRAVSEQPRDHDPDLCVVCYDPILRGQAFVLDEDGMIHKLCWDQLTKEAANG